MFQYFSKLEKYGRIAIFTKERNGKIVWFAADFSGNILAEADSEKELEKKL